MIQKEQLLSGYWSGVLCHLNSALRGIVDVWNYIEESSHLDWYRGGDQMIGNQIRENCLWIEQMVGFDICVETFIYVT